jgi:hypothetical protein
MEIKIIKIIEYIGEEQWINNTLENSLVNNGEYVCHKGKITAKTYPIDSNIVIPQIPQPIIIKEDFNLQ